MIKAKTGISGDCRPCFLKEVFEQQVIWNEEAKDKYEQSHEFYKKQ